MTTINIHEHKDKSCSHATWKT